MTLHTKTMLILVATVIFSLGGSGYIFLDHFKETFKKTVFQTIDAVALNNAHAITAFLKSQQEMIEQSGKVFPTEKVLLNSDQDIELFLKRLSWDLPTFDGGFFFLDTAGTLQAAYPSDLFSTDENFAEVEFFRETMAGRQGVAGTPALLGLESRPVLVFSAYISSRNGDAIGMLGGLSSLSPDSSLAAHLQKWVGKNGYSYVIDRDRHLIVHPDKNRVLGDKVPVGANELLDQALAGFQGVGETINSRGVPMFVSFHPVADSNWVVASQQPISEALAPVRANIEPLLYLVIFGSLVAALVGMFLVHRSMRGLVFLERATATLMVPTEADLDYEISYKESIRKLEDLKLHKEFGSLAATIAELYSRGSRLLMNKNKMAEELEIAYRKLKSTQAQIVQQEKMASVGQLAAGVAHEINNPIGFIGSNLRSLGKHHNKLKDFEMLVEKSLVRQVGEEQRAAFRAEKKKLKVSFCLEDMADVIAESCEGVERIRGIVQNLSSFSRNDQTKPEALDVNQCIESTLAIAWNEIKYKAKLEKDLADLPLLKGYPQQLNQVLLNLLMNAVHALGEQGVIWIRTTQERDWVKLTVQDNGSGIAADDLDRIFEPFFTTKEVGKGTGLGLSISYDIVRKHKGELKVESVLGEGTTFTILLPVMESA